MKKLLALVLVVGVLGQVHAAESKETREIPHAGMAKKFVGLSDAVQNRACAEVFAGLAAAGGASAKTEALKERMDAAAAMALGSGFLAKLSKDASPSELKAARKLTLEVADHLNAGILDVVKYCAARVNDVVERQELTPRLANEAMTLYVNLQNELSQAKTK
jgi:hypothetical protein